MSGSHWVHPVGNDREHFLASAANQWDHLESIDWSINYAVWPTLLKKEHYTFWKKEQRKSFVFEVAKRDDCLDRIICLVCRLISNIKSELLASCAGKVSLSVNAKHCGHIRAKSGEHEREEQEQEGEGGRGRSSKRWRMRGYPRDFYFETKQNIKKKKKSYESRLWRCL